MYKKNEDLSLLAYEGVSGQDTDPSGQIITSELDRLINNCQVDKTRMFTFILAMGNAADAVEIICVGYILNEMDDATTQNKGIIKLIYYYICCTTSISYALYYIYVYHTTYMLLNIQQTIHEQSF
jgi:hypothetical protein